MMPRLSALLLLCAVLAPVPGAAQVTLGLGTGVGVLVGDDFDGNEGGTTLNVEGMLGPATGWQFGGVFQYTSLGLEGSSESVDQIEALGAVRYLFRPEFAQLYLGARGGWIRHGRELEGEDLSSTGFTVGPTVGVILPFPWFGFEISMDARYLDMGDPAIEGSPVPGVGGSGVQVGGRVGVSFLLGN
jgi:hypothetical protein